MNGPYDPAVLRADDASTAGGEHLNRHDRALARAGLIAGGACGATALGYFLPAVTRVIPSSRGLFGIAHPPGEGGVHLTFDDGPHPQASERILEILADRRVRAAFFLVGAQTRRWPETAARIGAAGHAIGVHCHHHRSLLRCTPAQVEEDLERAVAALADAGLEPGRYRPPYGVLSTPAAVMARRRGWSTWLWDCDGRDWRSDARAGGVAERVVRTARPGSTILLHDSPVYCRRSDWRVAPEALERILDRLDRRGLPVAAPSAA
jgi:peptidoglycan/xylan/chitin deacetylase (PgdA/CDA1 family)